MEVDLRWYRQGTISIDAGDTAVNGTSTSWEVTRIKPGDILVVSESENPDFYEITSITSDTALVISPAYRGAEDLTNADYAIIRNFNNTFKPDLANNITSIINKYAALADGSAANIEVVDNLNSTRTDAALSAKQGKILNETKADKTDLGTLGNLSTTTKTSAVAAINEIVTKTGTLANLNTTNKTDLVTAINEVTATTTTGPLTVSTGFDNADAGFHNSIFRGKNLGTSVSAAQYASIANGSFANLFIGDYWVINDIIWRIAHFNYYVDFYGNARITNNHAVILPDTCLYTASMNNTDIVTNGYNGSAMLLNNLNAANTTVQSIFNGHVLEYNIWLSGEVTDGVSTSDSSETTLKCSLMSERQVYGSRMAPKNNTNYDADMAQHYNQFNLFKYDRKFILAKHNNTYIKQWLSTVFSNTEFSAIGEYGEASSAAASSVLGVRPFFLLY